MASAVFGMCYFFICRLVKNKKMKERSKKYAKSRESITPRLIDL